MMPPTTYEIRSAMEVLKSLDQHLQERAVQTGQQVPPTVLGDHYAGQMKIQINEKTVHIEKVVQELQDWREELLKAQKQSITQSI